MRGKITPETSEKGAIKDYLRFNGWFVFHNLAGLGVYPGIPDFCAIKNGHVVMIEAKAPKIGKKKAGKQSENQAEFQADWELHGGYYVCGDLDIIMDFMKAKGL